MMKLKNSRFLFPSLIFSATLLTGLGMGLVYAQTQGDKSSTKPHYPLTKEDLSVMTLQETYRTIADTCLPTVVSLAVESVVTEESAGFDPFSEQDEFLRRFFGQPPAKKQPRERKGQAFGSGFLISEDGYLISNHHVVNKAKKITVKFSDSGKEYEGKLIGTDPDTDLALVKIEGHGFPYLALGNSDLLRIGDIVVAIGNPFGLTSTFTTGVVSAKGRNQISEGPRFQNFIQSDVAINPGNSGGPLININGEVVGINSMILSQSGGNIGIAFSIPITMAKEVVEQLKNKGSVTRGWLGVAIVDISPEMAKDLEVTAGKGVYVSEVTAGSPAEKAGIKAADIILDFNGTSLATTRDLINVVSRTAPGTTVAVQVLRANKKVTLKVLVEGKASQVTATEKQPTPEVEKKPSNNYFGIVVSEQAKGLVITDIDKGSPFKDLEIRPGDVIKMIDYEEVSKLADYQKLMESKKNNEKILFHIQRGNSVQPVVIRPKAK